jgi:hypothetical protein
LGVWDVWDVWASKFLNFLSPGGWVSGKLGVKPIVEATRIEEIGEDGVIPSDFTVKFCPKVYFSQPIIQDKEEEGEEMREYSKFHRTRSKG